MSLDNWEMTVQHRVYTKLYMSDINLSVSENCVMKIAKANLNILDLSTNK